ncbi:hypothetical protein AN958_02200 [Leucoagaricus sp. SymC.cos]|nr:hypothetical protein AN958_02200 [Leucoagaricus sp. SymC.cos]
MSRLMLNLHETVGGQGIMSTRRTTWDGWDNQTVEIRRESLVELDTIVTENIGCEPCNAGRTRGSMSLLPH